MAITKIKKDRIEPLTKNDVGLTNVDNTSDLNKPISTATLTALNAKISGSGTSSQISFFNSNSSIAGDTSLLWDNTNKQLSLGTAMFNQSTFRFQDNYGLIFGVQTVSGSSIFHTNVSNGTYGYGIWLGHNLQFNGTNFIQPRGDLLSRAFTVNHHRGFSFSIGNSTGVSGGPVTMTQVASISSTGIITIASIVANNLPNGNSDATYVRNIIQKADGTIGWENKATVLKNEAGQVKVNYTGLSITGFTNNTSKQFNIRAGTPTIVASPTTKYPNSTPNSYLGIFDSTRNGGTTTFAGRLIENPVLGQSHRWRIIGNYSGRTTLLAETQTLYIRLRNPVSGFIVPLGVVTLAPQQATGDFSGTVETIADNASIPSPNGYILEAITTYTDANLTVNITSITRFSDAIEP